MPKGMRRCCWGRIDCLTKNYEFTLILSQVAEVSDDQGDQLYEAGCDDGTVVSRDGIAFIHFSRDSSSLENTIQSATSDVQSAGFQVAHIEVPCPS